MMIVDSEHLKKHLREQYAFPGGYEKIYICQDGGILCHDCILSNWREVLSDSFYQMAGNQWRIVAVQSSSDYDPPLHCDHCSRNLSPYEELED